MFAPLRAAATGWCGERWPQIAELQRMLDHAGVRTASGLALRVLPPGLSPRGSNYERCVYERGELETREDNWHDLFNVLMWLAFPRAKAALNARHCASVVAGTNGGRGPVRDTLTLFDESGVIAVSADGELLRLIERFEWHALFWMHRHEVIRDMRFIVFGHALYEKGLAAYKGMTGRGLLFSVPPAWLVLSVAEQLGALDAWLAERIADPRMLLSTAALAPIPVQGVPGWCAENNDAAFYADMRVFRPRRRASAA